MGTPTVKYFRLITVLHGCYIILAKVLANCLKPMLPSLVSVFQGLALEGSQDLSLLRNEFLDSRVHYKKGGVMFKVDF